MQTPTREEAVFMATLTYESEEWGECIRYVKEFALHHQELNDDERELVGNAYKHVLNHYGKSLIAIEDFEKEAEQSDDADSAESDLSQKKLAALGELRIRLIGEMSSEISDLCSTLETHVIPFCQRPDSIVYLIMRIGDAHRYLHRCLVSDERKSVVADESEAAYRRALGIGRKSLPPTNPIYLGLVLNFGVFLYEVRGSFRSAEKLCMRNFEDAMAILGTVHDEEESADVLVILQLLRENVDLWTDLDHGRSHGVGLEGNDDASEEGAASSSDDDEFV